jgi:hypothetical protein
LPGREPEKVMAVLKKKEGGRIDPESHEESEYGIFAWIKDREGNRIERQEASKGGRASRAGRRFPRGRFTP